MSNKSTYLTTLLGKRNFLLVGALCFLASLTVLTGANSISVVASWIVNVVPLLFLSMAAAIIISSGHVDISTGAIMSFLGMLLMLWVGVFGADIINIISAHLLVLTIGIGFYLGMYCIIRNNVSSLIITLAMYFIAKGLSTLVQICMQGAGGICRPLGAGFLSSTSGVIPSYYILDIFSEPYIAAAIIIGLVISLHYWRYFTRSGVEHIAVGLNQNSARYAGISIRNVHFLAFLLAGLLVCMATFLRLHGQTHGGWSANTGWGEELLAIAIAVIGGAKISGGRFEPISIALAALVIYAMRDVVTNDLKLPSELASIVFGIIMGLVVWGDSKTQTQTNN